MVPPLPDYASEIAVAAAKKYGPAVIEKAKEIYNKRDNRPIVGYKKVTVKRRKNGSETTTERQANIGLGTAALAGIGLLAAFSLGVVVWKANEVKDAAGKTIFSINLPAAGNGQGNVFTAGQSMFNPVDLLKALWGK